MPPDLIDRLRSFLRSRLSPEGRFGLHLTLGAAVLVAAVWLFGEIADEVFEDEAMTALDARISDWFRRNATPSGTVWMTWVSAIASRTVATVLCVAAAIALLWKRQYYLVLALLLVVPCGGLLNMLLKLAFARARPGWPDVSYLGYSFPSGHTMTATLLYGYAGVLCLLFLARSWTARALTAACVSTIIAAVAFSRVYLGAHYVSDVIGAFAAGTAWLAICLTAVETLRRHRHRSS